MWDRIKIERQEIIMEKNLSFLREYFADCTERIMRTDFETLEKIADTIVEAKVRDAQIFTAGNGGSAATASHICNDLMKGCRILGRVGYKTQCLSDSSPVLTCLANDFCYEDAYEIALRTKAKRGDILIVFSGSGNSENIVCAVKAANEMGIISIAFLGRDGGKLNNKCTYQIIAPTDSMEELEDMHMLYAHALAVNIRTKLADIWDMEIIRDCPAPKFKSALFDFDGTVSLIRSGWQDVMIPYFVEVLDAVKTADETNKDILNIVRDFVDTLTGKQTIFQCIRLDEEVVKRGGAHQDPLVYKHEYLRRLSEKTKDRIKGLENGTIKPEELIVSGCHGFVNALKSNGITCRLASGTDEEDVLREAKLLGLDKLFDGRVYGAHDGVLDCSKELVIKSLIEEEGIKPEELISFGDGYVEIELVSNLGGYTVGVATDEERKKGVNDWKRNRLKSAGADMIIPDFSGYERLIKYIGGK